MKFRKSFVTNSSSSSYIIIGNGDILQPLIGYEGEEYLIGVNGERGFGWQNESYEDTESKINFAFLQCQIVKNRDWYQMLVDVIKEHTGAISVNSILIDELEAVEGYLHGYIDHQSSSHEGENTEIFKSKETLRSFLFDGSSYIQCGNDNE